MKQVAKKILLLIGIGVIITTFIAGCGNSNSTGDTSKEQNQQQNAGDTNQADPKQPDDTEKPGEPPKGGPDQDLTQDTTFLTNAASALGITADELKSAFESGKKLDQIITDQGMTMEQFRQKMPEPQQKPPMKVMATSRRPLPAVRQPIKLKHLRSRYSPYSAPKGFTDNLMQGSHGCFGICRIPLRTVLCFEI
ncbi:Fis family transcriptional regulator [Desulforamulus ruminis]|uniref:Fis family transcriptional regulator n=1 Tax=Desulforamulus ruminis TaxID=1564 RepID=UPI002355FCDE|nr:Fis family transcriptional regulator [Desulforamulus ruminis]